jgi:hypothetical protein
MSWRPNPDFADFRLDRKPNPKMPSHFLDLNFLHREHSNCFFNHVISHL